MRGKDWHILSNSAKFSPGRPLLPAYNFSATMTSTCSTYRFEAVPSLKSLATENMPWITVLIFDDRHQLEAHNFKTAQHIDKRPSSRIHALQNGISEW